MGQKDALRALDAELRTAFAAAESGLSDVATYTPPGGGAAVPDIVVLVDEGIAQYGPDGEVTGARTEVTIYRADVEAPAEGGLLALADGTTLRLEALADKDSSQTLWIVEYV